MTQGESARRTRDTGLPIPPRNRVSLPNCHTCGGMQDPEALRSGLLYPRPPGAPGQVEWHDPSPDRLRLIVSTSAPRSREIRKGCTAMLHPKPTATSPAFSATGWASASACGPNGGNCVEVNLTAPGRVGVRDSKRLTGDVLLNFDTSSWSRFLTDMRAGTFDID
ncbi:DUF397 domain-containing protein [Saccharopolyspora sp. NPDC049357]|uniref:DUF397 domain-containing protein n=1 Tax=Saccharopolyspora sp. NPDC049357 TaxID=3154507 RepID=UPI00343D62E7